MDDNGIAQTLDQREVVDTLDREFARLHMRSCTLVENTPADLLYAKGADSIHSVGEYLLRCSGVVEQIFGGITANLWDDPFEWTLPEQLSTPAMVIQYLEEVEATRGRAFSSFSNDTDLAKQIVLPSGDVQPLIRVLEDTLMRATAFQQQAAATLKFLSGISPAGFII